MIKFLNVTERKDKTYDKKKNVGTFWCECVFAVPLVIGSFCTPIILIYLYFNFTHLELPNLTNSSL